MTRRRKSNALTALRRATYKTSRAIGDFQAAQRGPEVLGKRLERRSLTRSLFRWLR